MKKKTNQQTEQPKKITLEYLLSPEFIRKYVNEWGDANWDQCLEAHKEIVLAYLDCPYEV